MRTIMMILVAVAFPAVLFAASGKSRLITDGAMNLIQVGAPDGKKDFSLTGKSQTIDMRNDLWWAAYPATGGIFRTMTTATKAGTAHTLPATTWTSRGVNPASPYINFSGAIGTGQRH